LGILTNRLVRIEEARLAEHPDRPAARDVAGHRDRALVERFVLVVELRQVDRVRGTHPLAAWAHAAGDAEAAAHRLSLAPLDGNGASPADRRDVERVRLRPTDMRLTDAAEDDAQERVGIGHGADRR